MDGLEKDKHHGWVYHISANSCHEDDSLEVAAAERVPFPVDPAETHEQNWCEDHAQDEKDDREERVDDQPQVVVIFHACREELA